MKKSTIVIITIISLGAGFSVAWLARNLQPIQLEAGLWLGDEARSLPNFELVDHNGGSLERDDMQGKWHLLFFGYTHCPDVCPGSLQALADMLRSIDDSDVSSAIQVDNFTTIRERLPPSVHKCFREGLSGKEDVSQGTQGNSYVS